MSDEAYEVGEDPEEDAAVMYEAAEADLEEARVKISRLEAERDGGLMAFAQLNNQVAELITLLRSSDLGRSCGYDYKATKCPMTTPCWHHRRNAALARLDALSKGTST